MIKTNRLGRITSFLLFASQALSCANRASLPSGKEPSAPPAASAGKNEFGLASIYHDHRTASGERFNSRELTAAHRTLPFGTRVRVTSVRTGRSVIVRINDRGPFMRGRVIDLTAAAAAGIGLDRGMGITKVEVSRLH